MAGHTSHFFQSTQATPQALLLVLDVDVVVGPFHIHQQPPAARAHARHILPLQHRPAARVVSRANPRAAVLWGTFLSLYCVLLV